MTPQKFIVQHHLQPPIEMTDVLGTHDWEESPKKLSDTEWYEWKCNRCGVKFITGSKTQTWEQNNLNQYRCKLVLMKTALD